MLLSRTITPCAAASLWLAAAGASAIAGTQTTGPVATSATVSRDAQGPGSGSGPVPGAAVERAKRAPLLREGSYIARSVGTVRLDEKRNEWIFVPEARDASGLEREFVILPNETLGETKRTLDLSPRALRFEATGEVFIYQSRNYLLLSMVTPLVDALPANEERSDPAPPAARDATSVDEEQIAEELERRLAERIKAVPKAPMAGETSDAGDESAPRGNADTGRRTAIRVQSRRGHLLRDSSTGGWRFVYDGQPADNRDPSMPILPCLALERVENLVRLAESQAPLVVSGTTTTFEGRTYLLPTSFRLARGGKGIDP